MFAAHLMNNAASRPHMEKLLQAHRIFVDPAINTDQERPYHVLYEDIRQHEAFWFERVFCEQVGPVPAEWTLGILGMLATIRHDRCDVAKCLEILELDERVLSAYRDLVNDNDPEDVACLRALTYKYNLIEIYANKSARNKQACLKAFRAAARYEIEEGYDIEQQRFAFMLTFRDVTQNHMTFKFLDETPDDFVWTQMMARLQMSSSRPTRSPLRVEPWLCDGCGAREEMCGDFQRCGACKNAYYCTKTCQREHWRLHKPDCRKKSPKINVPMKTIKETSKRMIEMYAEVLVVYTRIPVSEENQKAAFPGAVVFFRDFIARHREYDSPAAFCDARHNREFRTQLDKYFEEQRGFESLVSYHQEPEVRAFREQELSVTPDAGIVFNENEVMKFAKSVVGTLALTPGFMEGNVLDPGMLERANVVAASTVKAFILQHTEYNSYGGFQSLKENEDLKQLVANAMTQLFHGEGSLADS